MNSRINHGILAVVIGAATVGVASAPCAADDLVIRAGKVYVADGSVIENGVVIVREGRIAAVGRDLAVPAGARVIDMPNGSVTPGLIDANAILEPTDAVTAPESRRGVFSYIYHNDSGVKQCLLCDGAMACALASTHDDLEPGDICPICGLASPDDSIAMASGVMAFGVTTESSSEVVPHTLMIDALNLNSPDFDRLLRGGVTTVFAAPDNAAVIGPRGAVVRTSGPLTERVIDDMGPVQASISSDAIRVGGGNSTPGRGEVTVRARRPNSRMGVAFVFRKAFHDAEAQGRGLAIGGADLAPDKGLAVIRDIRSGKTPLRIMARTQRDILTAMRLAEEFGLTFTLVEATEAYACLDEIRALGKPVIYGPIEEEPSGLRARTGETEEARLNGLRALLDAGIQTALTAQDLREEDGLARQAMYAIRAGLTRDEALRCVTSTPAAILGIADQVGTVSEGKRADIVIWSGEPFEATSAIVAVVAGGKVEYQGGNE